MARLTVFSKLMIVLAVVVGAYFAVTKLLPQFMPSMANGEKVTNSTSAGTSSSDDSATAKANASNKPAAQPSTGKDTRIPFPYTPPAPVGGKLKGVVEMGATGFNSFIISVDNKKNWKLEKAEYGSSLVYEKLADDADIKAGLKNYIADMLAYGVGAKDIHFIISSGAKKVEITSKIISSLKGMGYFVNEVTPEKEGEYALRSALPRDYYGDAFVVDIGSGNTKISWVNSSAKVEALEAPGSKYFQNNKTDDAVYSEVSGKARRVPSANRGICFVIGGIPFELAKQVREDKERYTVLKAPGDYTAEGQKQAAGLNIYKAIADATGCNQFIFDWDANFSIGFLLSM